MITRRAIASYLVASAALAALALAIGWWQVDGPGAARISAPLRPLPLMEMSFSMQNQNGVEVSPRDLVGKPSLVFFGYTFCPDVCPTTLSDISTWLTALDAGTEQLNVVFITVDPARDTVAAMAQYIGYFHPALQGWTGSKAETDKAVANFRASYRLGDGPDYPVDHTSGVFLFQADGRFAGVIDLHEDRAQAVAKVERLLRQ